MSERRPLIAGNWKMFKTHLEATSLVQSLGYKLPASGGVEVAICPPFTALRSAQLVKDTDNVYIELGAQDMHWEDEGAFTGQVSPTMLKSLGCKYVIIGHSERRQLFGETNETVNKKISSAMSHGLVPIFCCGETLEQREAGQMKDWLVSQIKGGLAGIEIDNGSQIVVAYEPIWAIGTGMTATPQDANDSCRVVRETLADLYTAELAESIRILYGGSVKPDNSIQLMIEPQIDGALVGGASLKADDFLRICNYKSAGM